MQAEAEAVGAAIRERPAPPCVIVACSPKGGVGKTTVARCVLVAAAQAGMTASWIDFDPQQSLAKWSARRDRSAAEMPKWFSPLGGEAAQLADWRGALTRASWARVVVVDTPPSVEANLPAIRGLCEAARVVLVPTGQTRDDLDSVLPWMGALMEAGARASFVLNKANRRTTSFGRSRTRLLHAGPVCPVEVPALEDVHTTSDHGLTSLDVAKSKGQEALEGLWAFVRREAGL